jgi:hypothetical protein
MEHLLHTFDFLDPDRESWAAHLYARSRPGETWQGWFVFTRHRDGVTYTTDVETTQPSADHVLLWAQALTSTYFDGAFERARRAHDAPPVHPAPLPLRDARADHATYHARLTAIERDILACFTSRSATQLETKTILDTLPHAHADVVRALEALEKRERLLVRRTEGGTDWVVLTVRS